jgi:CDP-paratose 2-epimerase
LKTLITGGAGFIGSNLAHRLLSKGQEVVIYDNLARRGTEKNVAWLRENHGEAFQLIKGDVRDAQRLEKVVGEVDLIYHLAAQVAVTTSVLDPREDFGINALGTFNVLEAARRCKNEPIVVFTSTNKVYGALGSVEVVDKGSRYDFADLPQGVSESYPLDFHSPYGCSKGAADQYVRDYARIYGLPTVVFRMSCIYGPRQLGNEDQGWLAHFLISSLLGRPITIYGDGKQVRDILYIDDLLDAFESAVERIEVAQGQVYNIGGGRENTISVWVEFKEILSELLGHSVEAEFSGWRPGDQPVYISDISKAHRELVWSPQVSVREGLRRLFDWVTSHRDLFE